MEVDDIISYAHLVHAEGATLQKGMNFEVGGSYSVFLMSLRKGAPYADAVDAATGTLIYEGHDQPRSPACPDPKTVDQPLLTPNGSWTENGKFFRAAIDYKSGLRRDPEHVKVYEKLARGIWSYKGFFELVGATVVSDGTRDVFKFSLKPVEKKPLRRFKELPTARLIPTTVKLEVWQRDQGKCVLCGATDNLHFDHDIPHSKGGSSLTSENVRILCLRHNLHKSDKIMVLMPWVGLAATSALHITKRL